jgi:hypothetical protein
MHKTLLSVSLWMLPTGCSAVLDLKDVQIVDGGSDLGPDGTVDGAMTDRMYHCGYAASGKNCDNGRRSQTLLAPDMTAAIAACKEQKPKPKLDFCYVKDDGGLAATDESQCMAASGSWRPDSNCCNFMGTLSCSASP